MAPLPTFTKDVVRRAALLIALAATVVSLPACASGGSVASSPSTSEAAASAPESPTPSSAIDTAARPAFGGDCASVVDAARLSSILGRELGQASEETSTGVRTLGGLECVWRTGSGSAVRSFAAPVDVVSEATQSRYGSVVCEGYLYDGWGCRIAVRNDTTWLLVTIDGEVGVEGSASKAQLSEDAGKLAPLFQESLAASPAPRAATPSAGWWAAPTCEDLGSRLDLAGILDSADFESGYPSGFATDIASELAIARGTMIDCKWYSSSAEGMTAIVITAYPGAADEWEQLENDLSSRTTVTPVVVAGAQQAIEGTGAIRPESSFVAATDGINLIQVAEAPRTADATASVIAALSQG